MVAAVHLLNEKRGPYVLYRSVPLLFGGGFLLELCDGFSATLTTGLGLFAIITASSLVFTDKAADALSTIANQRAQQEAGGARPDKMAFIAPFANAHGLSKRETEVLTCLIQGRTMQYTAEKLFIAESTARTHVHKIYQKTESQGRMELLDCFEQFCAEQDGSRTGGRRR